MALDSRAQAAIALSRFGFMPKSGGPADPRAALLADLDNPAVGQISNPDLLSVGEAARASFAFRQKQKEARAEKSAAAAEPAAGAAMSEGSKRETNSDTKPDMAKQGPGVPQWLRETPCA